MNRPRSKRSGVEPHAHRDKPTRDDGYSIVEVAVSIVLLGIVVVPLLTAVSTGITASRVNRDLAQVETVLQNAADRVNRASTRTCDYQPYVNLAITGVGWSTSQASVSIKKWAPATTPVQDGSWVASSCTGQDPDEHPVQLVTIAVSSPKGDVRRTIQVVKSDV